MSWDKYSIFDAETKFSSRAGFQLSAGQVKLVEQCAEWGKVLNKAEVGCGKTVMATVASLMQAFDVSIVTTPPILQLPWHQWLSQVSDNVLLYKGSPRERKAMYEQFKTARWIICSHAIFRQDYEIFVNLLKRRHKEVIVDEAHWLKNPKSVLFRCVKNITAGNEGLQFLTGTPISKPLDSYSYIKLNTPKAYRSYAEFEAMHVAKRDFFKNPVEFCNLDLMAERLNARAVSATKEGLLGYSKKPVVPDCTYELSPEHMKLYRKLVDEQLLSFDDGSIIDASTSQKLRQALQQVVVNFDYFSNNPENKSAAYDLLDQTLEEIEVTDKSKSKLIVWTKYVRSSRSVTAYLRKLGINAVAAYSEVDSEANSQAFMHDENVRVLVAQAQSVGAGLNPQAVCWESLFLEIDTVPIYARQAMGRIDRMGQKHIPRIKIGRAKNTVQEYLYRQLLANDDLVTKIEPTKKGLRQILLGELA
jgi:ATP-dependent helicase HepA